VTAALAGATAGKRAAGEGFPGWHVWRSSHGRWWATRTGRDACWGRDGIPMTVNADDAAGLRALLRQVSASKRAAES
jgi:hypothetical protein